MSRIVKTKAKFYSLGYKQGIESEQKIINKDILKWKRLESYLTEMENCTIGELSNTDYGLILKDTLDFIKIHNL